MNSPLGHISSLILLAGLSGAGKSSALHFFADSGFYTIDNLPIALFSDFIDFSRNDASRYGRTALLLDIDSRGKLDDFSKLLASLDRSATRVEMIFLDCRKDTLLRRYSETRRPHPGFRPGEDRTLADAIDRERALLFPLRESANLVIDTSDMNIHELRRSLKAFVDTIAPDRNRRLHVNFLSFGYKYGPPLDCDIVMDVRFLPNPHFVEHLREKTGLESPVSDYVLGFPQTATFLDRFGGLLTELIPQYTFEGKAYLNVGIGCTGGKHRSVSIARALSERLSNLECIVSLAHRDIER